jgi:hypothetical protein
MVKTVTIELILIKCGRGGPNSDRPVRFSSHVYGRRLTQARVEVTDMTTEDRQNEKLTPLSLCASPNIEVRVATTLEFLMFRV